jgi:6-phosphogluconolactonase (cycloisomerase 2 family)
LSYATINTTTGALSVPTVAGSPAFNPDNYTSIVVAPSNNFLYAFYESFSELETFQMSGPGLQLTLLSGSDYLKNLPYEESMNLHPSGKFLYVIQSGVGGTIQEISINANSGALTLGTPVTVNADIRTGIFDPAGNFLYVNDLSGGRIFIYDVDQTDGSLTPAASSPFTLPSSEQPTYIAIGGSGTTLFLYADLYSSLHSGNGIAAFSINSSTGALTVVPGSPFQSTSNAPDYICVDPSGKFLYGTDSLNGLIDGFVINPTTGVLNSVPGSPFSTATTSDTIAIDPTGKFLYVTNYANSTIYGFSLDSVTGTISPLTGSPFPSVSQPNSLTMMNIP